MYIYTHIYIYICVYVRSEYSICHGILMTTYLAQYYIT